MTDLYLAAILIISGLVGLAITVIGGLRRRDDTRISRYEISTSLKDTDDWQRARARRGE